MSETPKPRKTSKKKVVKKKPTGYCKVYHNIKLNREAAEVAKTIMQEEGVTISQLVIKLLLEKK